MNGLKAIGIVLVGFGISLFALTTFIGWFVETSYGNAVGTISICIMMIVGGLVLIIFGGMD
jgi:hypothetical protein